MKETVYWGNECKTKRNECEMKGNKCNMKDTLREMNGKKATKGSEKRRQYLLIFNQECFHAYRKPEISHRSCCPGFVQPRNVKLCFINLCIFATTQCQTMLCKRMSHQEGTRPTLSHAKLDLRHLFKNCFTALILEAGLIKWRRYYAGVRDGQEYETVIIRKSGSCTNRVWTAQRSNRKSRPALCLSVGWNLGRFSSMTNVNGKHNVHCIPKTAIPFVTTPVQLVFAQLFASR